MKIKISVPEVVEIFNEIEKKPERLFEMIRVGCDLPPVIVPLFKLVED